MARRRRRNPEELPYGEWVPAHAVRFNEDGTVSLMTEGRNGNSRQRNQSGVSSQEVEAGARVMIAVTQAIHDAGEIPSGHLYAMLAGRMDHAAYEKMISLLLNTGLVEKRGDLLIWAGPN